MALTTCVARFWTLPLLKMPPKRRGASQPPGGRAAKAPRRPAQRTTDTPVRGRRRSASATATVTRPEDTSVDTTADAIANAVLLRLEQSGRLLPVRSPEVEVPAISTPPPLSATSSRSGVARDDSDPEHFLDQLLGGELPTQLPGYSIITRPLGSHISPTLRQNIIAGKYVNLSLLLQDDGLGDQHDHQQVTLQVTPGENTPHLAVVKPTHTKDITTIAQWSTAFCVYAAVLTEHFPQRAPGLFKHMSDVSDMARNFGGLAWKTYDECFRRDMTNHSLSFGQIHWDLRFRCLEKSAPLHGHPFRKAPRPTGRQLPNQRSYQTGQCFRFEQSGACSKSGCQYKHTCAKCSGTHPTDHCGTRSTSKATKPFGPRRGGLHQPANSSNTNKH